MFEGCYFMVHLKKENLIIPEITIHKYKCKNPMFDNESGKLSLEEIEEFFDNYQQFLLTKDFFKNEGEIKNEISILFDYKSKINYILYLFTKPENIINNENEEKKTYSVIISTKKEFNVRYDILANDLTEKSKFVNFIFVRKTEFGVRFNKEKMESIIKYLFNINNIIMIDNLNEETKQLKFVSDKYYRENKLLIFFKENNALPIIIKPDNEINEKIIPLIEYNYFISIPLLLTKKDDKPNILILSNDFGILNSYYRKLYSDNFNIFSYIE